MKNQEVNFADILKSAVEQKGLMMQAYYAFYNYSTMNQLWLMMQMSKRGQKITPVATFKVWKEKNRNVKKGEKALSILCPVNLKKDREDPESDSFVLFQWRNCLFSLEQTEGQDVETEQSTNKQFNKELALKELGIVEVQFQHVNGNIQGYAIDKSIAVNPLAQLPMKTMFHEMAHVLLGHTKLSPFSHDENTPHNIKEVEAECVALLCLESLGMDGSEYCRGYIQNWLRDDEICEQSAKRIMATANKILKAGTNENERKVS